MDLLVQLLSSEKIVGGIVDGFHRVQDVYGGKVINSLANNALNGKKEAAAKISALITEHKRLWIDQVILARDQLIHPQKGMCQLMFQSISQKRGRVGLLESAPAGNCLRIHKSILAKNS